jgi:sugar (pentulose or hexulose) kinase
MVEDYITFRLSGRFCSSLNLLSPTMFVDIHTRRNGGRPLIAWISPTDSRR